jgi:hypothetical protein
MSCHAQLRCQLRLPLTGLDALYFQEDVRQPQMPQGFVSSWQARSPKLVGSPRCLGLNRAPLWSTDLTDMAPGDNSPWPVTWPTHFGTGTPIRGDSVVEVGDMVFLWTSLDTALHQRRISVAEPSPACLHTPCLCSCHRILLFCYPFKCLYTI